MAQENLGAACRVTRSLHVKGASNGNAAHAFEEGRVTVSQQNAFRLHRVLQECCDQRSIAGFNRHPKLEMRIRRCASAGDEFARIGIGRDGEQFQPLIVQPEVELALSPHTQELVEPARLQAH